MEAIRLFKLLNRDQRNTFVACFLGWALDAFDFFLLTFVLVPVGHEFGRSIPEVAFGITLTLMMRPLGAFVFGLLGDKFGRRIPLMADIIFYSIIELLTAFAPNFTVFLLLRALFGVGMGGEWGLGASLAMETLPTAARGLFSGILQQGYAFGYLLAALVYGIAVAVRHFVDDGVQRDVAWNAGHVSNVSRRTAWLRRRTKIDNRRHLRGGCDLRRNDGGAPLAEIRPASRDHFRSDVRDPSDSRLGFFDGLVAPGDWWIRHAVCGAGRVGSCASAFE